MGDEGTNTTSGAGLTALLLRLTVGPMMMVHGYNKVTGPGGLEGTGRYFESMGLKPGKLNATLAASTELGAGALLTVGAMSPLPAAGMIGLMATAARTDHKGKGFFVFKGGWEYTAVVAAVSAISAALGPGPISIDAARGKARHGVRWAVVAGAIGLAGAAGILSRVEDPANEEKPAEGE